MNEKQEKKILELMISIYEKDHNEDLSELKVYAFKRIDNCPRKEKKTFCSSCPIHCYQKEYRNKIKQVMKYTGPRIIYRHPIIAFKHMINTIKTKINQS